MTSIYYAINPCRLVKGNTGSCRHNCTTSGSSAERIPWSSDTITPLPEQFPVNWEVALATWRSISSRTSFLHKKLHQYPTGEQQPLLCLKCLVVWETQSLAIMKMCGLITWCHVRWMRDPKHVRKLKFEDIIVSQSGIRNLMSINDHRYRLSK